jgi:hypothetical protein
VKQLVFLSALTAFCYIGGSNMKQLQQALAFLLMLAVTAATALAGSAGFGLPKKISGFEGWHGATIKKNGNICTLVFPRNFGKSATELNLLRQVANHYLEPEYDVDCSLKVQYAAWDQLKRLAIEDQNPAAAEMIIFAHEKNGLTIMGEFGDVYGETYLFPVLLGYKKLAQLIPPSKEGEVATEVCMTYYNPSTDEGLDFDGLLKRLSARHMNSLIRKIKKECDRIKPEM